MRTLIEKELRENLRWLPVGLLVIGALFWYVTPMSIMNFSPTEGPLAWMMVFGASAVAIGLGVLQSAFDLRSASRAFLFHRSVSVTDIFYSKLISGAILYALSTGIPLAVVAGWFAWNGIDHMPVRPADTIPAAVMAFACFGFHPAVLFTLARSGNWFGTKLFPMFAVASAVFLISTSKSELPWTLIGLSISLELVIIILAAKRAWLCSLGDEGNLPRHPARLPQLITLTLAALAVFLTAFAWMVGIEQLWTQPKVARQSWHSYAIDSEGNPWSTMTKSAEHDGRNASGNQTVYLSGEPLREGDRPNVRKELPPDLQLHELSTFFRLSKTSREGFSSAGSFGRSRVGYFDPRGYVLIYDRNRWPALQAIVSRNGLHPVGQSLGEPFADNPRSLLSFMFQPLSSAGYQSPWVDRKGIYQFDRDSGEVRTLLEKSIDAVSVLSLASDRAPQLLVKSDRKHFLYRLNDSSGKDDWFEPEGLYGSDRELPTLTLENIASMPPLPPSFIYASFGIATDSKLVAIADPIVDHENARAQFATFNVSTDEEWTVAQFPKPIVDDEWTRYQHRVPVIMAIMPWIVWTAGILVMEFYKLTTDDIVVTFGTVLESLQTQLPMVILAIVATLLAILSTSYVCHQRALSRHQRWCWCGWTILLGWAGPLAVMAIYPKPAYQRCPRCEKARRIDRRNCDSCGAAWEPPATEGIEIFDEGISGDRTLAAPARQAT